MPSPCFQKHFYGERDKADDYCFSESLVVAYTLNIQPEESIYQTVSNGYLGVEDDGSVRVWTKDNGENQKQTSTYYPKVDRAFITLLWGGSNTTYYQSEDNDLYEMNSKFSQKNRFIVRGVQQRDDQRNRHVPPRNEKTYDHQKQNCGYGC